MVDRYPHSALRELRDHLFNPRTLIVLLLAGGVLTIVGPFGAAEALPLSGLAAFWIGLIFVTYAVGFATDALLRPPKRNLARGLRVVVIAAVTGIAVALIVQVVTGLLFGWPSSGGALLQDLSRDFALGVCVSLAVQIAYSAQHPPGGGPSEPETPALLDRLPLDKRGALVALSVEDHYVRVRTMAGEEMLLMRLSDAMRETAPTAGLQVHRSHWVATGAVRAARREGDRAILTMATGGDIPASRSHIKAVRAAGLLPR